MSINIPHEGQNLRKIIFDRYDDLQKAAEDLDYSYKSLCEAAELPENEPHKEPLYERAVQVAQIAEGLNSASPVL